MKDNNAVSWLTSAVTILTGIAAEDVIRIVLLVIGCVSALVSLAFNIYCWYKKAKADGKIDHKEVSELKDILDKGTDDIKSLVDNKENKQ